MQLNITKQVIDYLSKQSPEFKLFFEHHFDIESKQSLTPKISKGKPSFPIEMSMLRKCKTLEQKIAYYTDDINEWNEKYGDFEGEYVILLMEK